jgi:hypothetical protein
MASIKKSIQEVYRKLATALQAFLGESGNDRDEGGGREYANVYIGLAG